ncbi:MAG: HEAT repeat domain-containing protein [Planctomycetota bacterium]|nr:HEAT repeat domain-containing protein [Planctomycetota bacterium]
MNQPELSGAQTPTTLLEIRKSIQNLLSDDFTTRGISLEQLEKYGAEAAQEIVRTMLKMADEPHAKNRLCEALEEIGKPSMSYILTTLDQISEIQKPTDAYLVLNLIETLYRIEDPSASEPVSRQLIKFSAAIGRNHNNVLVDICEQAKVRIHTILVYWNYSAASDDLHSMLGDGRKRVRDGLVNALGRFGDQRALLPLIRLYSIEESVSMSGASTIRQTFRDIIRRHAIGESESLFGTLSEDERGTLEKLFPKSKAKGTHR